MNTVLEEYVDKYVIPPAWWGYTETRQVFLVIFAALLFTPGMRKAQLRAILALKGFPKIKIDSVVEYMLQQHFMYTEDAALSKRLYLDPSVPRRLLGQWP